MLREHEAVIPVNEPLIGHYLSPFLSDRPAAGPEGLGADDFTLRLVQRNNSSQFFADEFRDAWLPGLARLMRERFYAHALRYPARAPLDRSLVVIKEPNGSQSADLIMEALPRSRLLFLLRDGRDVVDSELAASQRESWVGRLSPAYTGVPEDRRLDFVVQSAYKWLWRTELVEDVFARHQGPKHRLRYEDLLAEPERHVRAIVEWLGLAADEAWLRDVVERKAFDRMPAEATGSREFYRAATPGLWRENLTEEERAALERVIGPKLRELGYED